MVDYNFLEDGYYNVSKVFNDNVIEDTPQWIFDWNSLMGGYAIVAYLVVFGIVLFMLAKEIGGVKDSKAAVYAGFICSVLGMLLFFVEVDGSKLLEFNHLLVVFVATAVAILIDWIARE